MLLLPYTGNNMERSQYFTYFHFLFIGRRFLGITVQLALLPKKSVFTYIDILGPIQIHVGYFGL